TNATFVLLSVLLVWASASVTPTLVSVLVLGAGIGCIVGIVDPPPGGPSPLNTFAAFPLVKLATVVIPFAAAGVAHFVLNHIVGEPVSPTGGFSPGWAVLMTAYTLFGYSALGPLLAAYASALAGYRFVRSLFVPDLARNARKAVVQFAAFVGCCWLSWWAAELAGRSWEAISLHLQFAIARADPT